MKTMKKTVLLIFSAVLITVGFILINAKVKATQGDEVVYLKLEEFRQKELDCSTKQNSGSGKELAYKSLTEKIMWKICEVANENAPVVDKYKTIYCIKAGPGFGSGTGTDMGSMNGGTQVKTYTKVFDLKNKESIESTYSSILPTGKNYNSLVWVLEHCYIPTNDESKKEETKKFRENLLAEAEKFVKEKTGDGIGVNIINSGITDNEIDIVQQLAIWHFTNDNDKVYDIDETECNFDFHIKEKDNGDWMEIEDKYDDVGWDRLAAAQDLFYYFVNAAADAQEPTPSVTSSPVTLKSDNAKAIQYGDKYIIGPYTLTATSNVEYSLEKTSSTDIKLLNSRKEDITSNDIKSLVGNGEFYISVPSSTDLEKLNISITATVNQTNLKYRSVTDGNANGKTEQPVVEVEREEKPFPIKITIPEVSKFDLALRKSITKIGEIVHNRLPNVVATGLSNSDTTAKYNHAKDALQADTNQIIEYTLTIFNEGQIDGYAKEVVDYLPAGITFVQGIGTEEKWEIESNSEAGGITKLTIKNIESNPTILNAYTGSSTPSSISIKLKCRVTAQRQATQQVLTNIAEITKHSDESGNETIVDRDSLPNNFPPEKKNNAYSGSSQDGNYVKGQQDDDDFEKIVIPAAKGSFSLQLLKVDSANSSPLQGAKFKVKLSGASQEYTNLVTESNGIVTISDIPITSAGTSVYEITEEEPPKGYNKLINVLKVQVETVLQGSEYVVQSTSITEGKVEGSETVLLDNKTIKVTIPNDKITGKFNLKIVKYEKDNQAKKLAGATFEITKPDNSKETLTTIADGSVTLSNLDIPGVGTYTYTIKETQTPTGYEKIIEEIQVKITTEIKNGKYVVKSTEIVSNPQSVDGIISTVGDNEVKIDVPNTKKSFELNLELLKVDYSNNTLKLPGAIFEITMPDNTKQNLTIGEDGTAKLQNIKIEKEGTYTFTIKETKAPNTYIPFKETYTLTVKVGLVNDEYVIQEQTLTSSKTQAEEGKITSKATSELNGTVTIKVTLENKQFDLALRKFVSKIGDKEYNRASIPNTENLNKLVDGKKVTGAEYVHPKDSVRINRNDEIIYTIRVYNEGEIDGYASEVVDYLPEELEFIKDDELNLRYGWTYDDSDVDEQGRVRRIKTNYTAKDGKLDVKTAERPNGTLIKAYNSETKNLDYIDLQVKCKVRNNIKANKNLTNIAEITNTTDYEGTKVTDRDSTEDSLTKSNSKPEDKNPEDNLPSDEQLPGYKDDEVKEGKEYIPGQQDDDDFEKVVVQEFDLALRKFIAKVNNKDVEPSREPQVDVSGLVDGTSTTAVKESIKTPVKAKNGDTILYTIRVYNEGDINAYVGEITDYLPEGLQFIENSSINEENGWTNPSGDGKTIVTRKHESTLLNAFDGEELKYLDVQVECKIVALNKATDIKNIAEITEQSDEEGNKDVEDRDSKPDDLTDKQKEDYNPENPEDGKGYEDDDDFEDIELQEFDLALRKFISKINNRDLNPSREPEVDVNAYIEGTSTTLVKEHTKTPLKVQNGDIVLYTVRVYNEGEVNAYVGEITDYLPKGLKFVNSSEINRNNGWENPTGDGKTFVTRKYEKTLLNAFNGKELAYLDVQMECEVVAIVNSTSVKNIAEITEHSDEDGNKDIKDRDSTPEDLTNTQKENYNPENPEKGKGYEDDDDSEDLILKEMDLALKKFITKINNTKVEPSREPQVNVNAFVEGTSTTFVKDTIKDSLRVKRGDTVLYTIRVYNEGEINAYVDEITDYLPEGLEFIENSSINKANGWTNPFGDGKTIVTRKYENTLLNAFDGKELKYVDVEVECKVIALNKYTDLKNIAEISEYSDSYGNLNPKDRDSSAKNLTDAQKENYNPEKAEKGKGYEDDDDYEELKIQEFDLSLRKFISKVNNKDVEPSREPQVDVSGLLDGTSTTAVKESIKTPVKAKKGDTILYTIRVYNEGDINAYVGEITDYLPEGLEYIEDSRINIENGWTNPTEDGKTIVTRKHENTLLNAFDGEELAYLDVQVECKVVALNKATDLKNIAEITEQSDEEGNKDVEDRDSTPDNLTDEQKEHYNPENPEEGKGYEDDDDFEDIELQEFDLALRKFISKVNNKDVEPSREPQVDVSALLDGTSTTAVKESIKTPVKTKNGDTILYTIRVYNEGDINAYVGEITDYLPEGLQFIENSNINKENGWTNPSGDGKTIVTRKHENTLLNAFNGEELAYLDVQVECKIIAVNKSIDLKNIAEITEQSDEEGNKDVEDRDSTSDNLTDEQKENYNPENPEEGKGYEDDDDFEDLELQEFDLSLRKFITKVNNKDVEPSREPKVDVSGLLDGSSTTAIKEHSKEPVEVYTNDIIVYTIRVYNEGEINAYVGEITDYIPEGLEFIEDSSINRENGWTNPSGDGKTIVTRKHENTLLNAFNGKELAYLDVQVECKVIAKKASESLKNIAEITEHSDEDGNKDIEDKDSTPDDLTEEQKEHYDPDEPYEDDDDSEDVVIKERKFDLSLRKFITVVDGKEIEDRIPKFKVDEDGNYVYEHSKEPLKVENGNIIIYTLRVYNEGDMAGFAEEVKDNIPDGLVYLPEDETNIEYRWKMLDEDGNETENVEEAVAIVTDYLSKTQGEEAKRDNLLLPFDSETMEEPDYRDVKVAFRIEEPSSSDRTIINEAQISDDADEDGDDVDDDDSTPDEWKDGDDDQDEEKVEVKYFDLSLKKWASQAILVVDGKQTIIDTGHKPEDNQELPVKIELVESKLNKTVLKFKYKIRVTNEGEIAGSATEISEYIPQGLRFVAADNPKWKEVDGKVVTDQLKDVILKPGESADVEILLTWINSKQNFGQMVNVAEISDDWNPSNTPDIDSTPNNKKPEEDDIDEAPVIPSIKTGAEVTYIGLILGSLVIIATGIIFIKKYVWRG